MRVKFKTIPGEQFIVRRHVFQRMQEKFKEAGIEFAHRNVTVYLPPSEPDTNAEQEPTGGSESKPAIDKNMIEAGAAAAIAAAEEEQAKQTKK